MKAEVKQDLSLQYICVEPDGYDATKAYDLMLVLHGFGANMQDLAGLTPMLSSTRYVYICPNAPLEFELGFGSKGYGWHPSRDVCTEQDLHNSVEVLDKFIDEVFDCYNFSDRSNKMLGFSQGGGMTYRCGLTKPDRFDQLVGLSASMPNPESLLSSLPMNTTQRIFIAHGTADSVVPIENAEDTNNFLHDQGYDVTYKTYDMGHEIREVVIADIVDWLQ